MKLQQLIPAFLFVLATVLSVFFYQNCGKIKSASSQSTDAEGNFYVTGSNNWVDCTVYNSVRIKNGSDYNVFCRYIGSPLNQFAKTLTYPNSCQSYVPLFTKWSVLYTSTPGALSSITTANEAEIYLLFYPGNYEIKARIKPSDWTEPAGFWGNCISTQADNININVPQMDVSCPWPNPDMCQPPATTPTPNPTPTPGGGTSYEAQLCITFTNTSGKHKTKCATNNTPEIGVSVDRTKPATLEASAQGSGQFWCHYRDKIGSQGDCTLSNPYTIDPSIYPNNYWIEVTVGPNGSSQGLKRKVSF